MIKIQIQCIASGANFAIVMIKIRIQCIASDANYEGNMLKLKCLVVQEFTDHMRR